MANPPNPCCRPGGEGRQDARALAEARFKQRERQKADAPLALKEYYAAEEAQREKTRRLRELRLASAAAKSQG